KAGDVVRDGAVEQRNILGQIPEVLTEIVTIPLVKSGAVETHLTVYDGPNSDQGASERRFSGRARSEQCQAHPGLAIERNIRNDLTIIAGREYGHVLHRQHAVRTRKLYCRYAGLRGSLDDFAQPEEALTGSDQLPPRAQRHLDRGQG